ncbi:MAG: NF038122 family metalloprotease [Planctomycetota bacterium]
MTAKRLDSLLVLGESLQLEQQHTPVGLSGDAKRLHVGISLVTMSPEYFTRLTTRLTSIMTGRRKKNFIRRQVIEQLEQRQLLASDFAEAWIAQAPSNVYFSRAVPVETLDASQVVSPVGGSRPTESTAEGRLHIELIPGRGLRANPDALAAARRAADQWESHIFDPITVSIEIDLGTTDPGVLGFAVPVEVELPYSEVRAALQADGLREADDSLLQRLPSADSIEFALPDGTEFSGDVSIAKANAKAIGLRGDELDDLLGVADGGIVMGQSVAFDYENSNGVESGLVDFETVVAHEIGHVLGFASSVDRFTTGTPPSTISPTPLDLFRFRSLAGPDNPRTPAAFEAIRRELRPSTPAVIDFVLQDGWELPSQQYPVELGEPANVVPTNPFGYQASHWQDADVLGQTIGILVPTIPQQRVVPISNVDLRAMDLIGYNILRPDEIPQVPVLNDDSALVDQTRVVIDVLNNDQNDDNPFQLSTFQIVEPAYLGEVEFDPVTGLVVYRIPPNSGSDLDAFTYTIANEQGIYGEPAVVELNITGVGQTPTAVDDFVLTRQDQEVTFNPLTNDFDNQILSLENMTILSGPSSGTVEVTSGGVRYVPNPAFVGNDSFAYRIVDSEGLEAEALVEITVGATLNPPAIPGQPLTLLQRSDVSGDQALSALDALMVINYLNQEASVAFADAGNAAYDVNRDGYVTAVDALIVINELNRGEGERASGAPPLEEDDEKDADEDYLASGLEGA